MNCNWICLESVSFFRNRRSILTNICWEVERGSHWAIIGANGSGKTTLLQLLAGYLWPTTGRITVLGERFGHTDLRELRKRIGWVGSFLEARIPPAQKPLHLIAGGKTATIGNFREPGGEELEKAREIAAALGCEQTIDSEYGILSQGEKQRLLIARALMNEPELLILDEPCAGLDIVAREGLLGMLQAFGETVDAPSMVFVTHHIEEIMPVFSHVLLLRGGRRLAGGTKQRVLESSVLSEAFGITLAVEEKDGRYLVRMSAPDSCHGDWPVARRA